MDSHSNGKSFVDADTADAIQSPIVQNKLEDYKKMIAEGRTLDDEQKKEFNRLSNKLEALKALEEPTPKKNHVVLINGSNDLKDGHVSANGSGKEGLKQRLLNDESQTDQKEVKHAFDFMYNGDYEGLGKYLSTGKYTTLKLKRSPSGSDFIPETEQHIPYAELLKNERQLILNEYAARNRCTNWGIQIAGWSGLAGEAFYIYWDLLARMEVTDWYLRLNNTTSWALNGLLTPFVASANAAFDPRKEARDLLESTMLNPENSLWKLIKKNKVLTIAFLAFAIGGSYIEVEKIYDDLNALQGGKFVIIALIVGAGTAYYGLFNFLDVIRGIGKWIQSPTCHVDPTGLDEWVTKIFVEFHKLLTIAERTTRIGFGGFRLGQQLSGGDNSIGYIMASIIGLSTLPVALGTRALATDEIYYKGDKSVFPDGIPGNVYANTKRNYELDAKQSWCNRLKTEAQLFFSASIWLQLPTAYLAGKLFGITYPGNELAQYAFRILGGSPAALAAHGIFRWPAKRAAIAKLCVNERLAQTEQNETLDNKPNLGASILSYSANAIDQSSRVLTLGYALNALFPKVFNVDEPSGREMLFLFEMCAIFIAVSAYRYQVKKTDQAYPALVPCLFAKKPQSDLDRYEEPNSGTYEAPISVRASIDNADTVTPITPPTSLGSING